MKHWLFIRIEISNENPSENRFQFEKTRITLIIEIFGNDDLIIYVFRFFDYYATIQIVIREKVKKKSWVGF